MDGMHDTHLQQPESAPNKAKKTHKVVEPTLASKILVVLLIVAAVLVIITLAAGLLSRTKDLAKDDQYQAVFLANGQVYFGKLSAANSDYLLLKDVYYLQENQQNVQANQDDGTDTNDSNNNLTLIKLGNELHGPEDEMFIEQDQVIFWENLKNNSRVVETINQQQ